MRQPEFAMERWQSRFENRVRYNLSDSGILPFSLREFSAFAGVDPADVEFGYGFTDGSPRLRERVAALYPGASPENVLVTTGSAEANFLVLWRLVEPGDRVVIVEPTYAQTRGLAEGLGAEVASLSLEESRGWQPAPGAATELIGEGTRLVVVTNPNNPTGAVLDEAARGEIVAAAERTGAWILVDEVYAGAELSGERTPTLWGATRRVVATASLSKAYGLQGLRLGWLVAPAELREQLWARKDYTTIAPSVLSDSLGAAALEPGTRGRVLDRTLDIVRANFALVERWAAEIDELRYRAPDAGAICLLSYAAPIASLELAERLRVDHDVLVVPGAHFGLEGCFRVGFGYETHDLPVALGRVRDALGGSPAHAAREDAGATIRES